jgi:predicted DNA-binding protein (UPF0251 family)
MRCGTSASCDTRSNCSRHIMVSWHTAWEALTHQGVAIHSLRSADTSGCKTHCLRSADTSGCRDTQSEKRWHIRVSRHTVWEALTHQGVAIHSPRSADTSGCRNTLSEKRWHIRVSRHTVWEALTHDVLYTRPFCTDVCHSTKVTWQWKFLT